MARYGEKTGVYLCQPLCYRSNALKVSVECRGRMMDLRQLRHFVALADYRNFGRAAEATNLSQPAFSRSIQTLERDLDCALVDRSSRELRLTGQGELVLQHARRLLAGS